MPENIEHIILEQLKAVRNDIKDFRTESSLNFVEMKTRIQSLEERATLTERGIANLHGDLALVQLRLDRQGEKIDRIETRMGLITV